MQKITYLKSPVDAEIALHERWHLKRLHIPQSHYQKNIEQILKMQKNA